MRVDAARRDVADQVGRAATERIDEKAGEDATCAVVGGILFLGRRGQDREALGQLGGVSRGRPGARDAGVAAVEDDDLVACLRLVGVGHNLGERDALVAAARVSGEEVAATALNVAVAGEVEQRDVLVGREQLLDPVLEGRSRHDFGRAGPSHELDVEVDAAIAVCFEARLDGAGVVDAAVQGGAMLVIVNANDKGLRIVEVSRSRSSRGDEGAMSRKADPILSKTLDGLVKSPREDQARGHAEASRPQGDQPRRQGNRRADCA